MKNRLFVIFFIFCLSIIIGSTGFADGSFNVKRHSGTYELDYSYVNAEGELVSDNCLWASFHGALTFVSAWGNGATAFNHPIPLCTADNLLEDEIYKTRDNFVNSFNEFVDSLDWEINHWNTGRMIYFNWLCGKFESVSANPADNQAAFDARETAKNERKEQAALYAENVVTIMIARWNALFDFLPDSVTIDNQYGVDLLAAAGIASFYFDDRAEEKWVSGMVHNARLTLPYIVPVDGFLTGTQIDGSIFGLGGVYWMAADEAGCFSPTEAEVEAGSQECNHNTGDNVDMASISGVIGELTCIGTVPNIIFGFDLGIGIAGNPRGNLVE